jgi:hypothetical protein
MNGQYRTPGRFLPDRFFIVAITAFALSCAGGCAPPIGNIDGPGERLIALPSRVSFDINDVFWRQEHVKVFTSYHGAMLLLSVDDVTIGIAEDPDLPDEQSPVPLNGGGYMFTNPGRKLVMLSYNQLSTRYWIQVDDPYDLSGGTGPGGGNNNEGGIIVKWEDDDDEDDDP